MTCLLDVSTLLAWLWANGIESAPLISDHHPPQM